MLTRDVQRLTLAVVLTLLLFYSLSVYLARGETRQEWLSYASDDHDAFKQPDDANVPQNIPIPFPDPKAEHHDASDGSNIALQEPKADDATKKQPAAGAPVEKKPPQGDAKPPTAQDALKPKPEGDTGPAKAKDPSKGDGPPAAAAPPATGDGKKKTLEHHEISSSSTLNKRYLKVDFGDAKVMNPNIIPHPSLENTWVIVAQRANDETQAEFQELSCNAIIWEDSLRCLGPATVLPVDKTQGAGKCDGDLSYFNLNVGPHDARVFYGPEKPYIVFGSNSMFTCFGQFVQAFPSLAGWTGSDVKGGNDFVAPTELQRPDAWGKIEKNWFLFWDDKGGAYVHHDIQPKRAFAKVNADGSVGPDLAPAAEASDKKCMAKYMPKIAPELESIHQATNSLRITMCRRSDADCVATDKNTYIFTIYQHKTYYNYHSVYEPYLMVFEQHAPFNIHGMSRKPLWINGRENHPDRDTSDMFYVTAMNWKSKERLYHGYLDDEIFIAFGIEDERAGGIDVRASDLFDDLGLCDTAAPVKASS